MIISRFEYNLEDTEYKKNSILFFDLRFFCVFFGLFYFCSSKICRAEKKNLTHTWSYKQIKKSIMSSIIHLPGMRYIRDGQVESMDDQQDNTKKIELLPQQWKPQHHHEQEKLQSGFYQTSADYSQSAQTYESILRNRSYLESAGLPPPPQQQPQQQPQQVQANHYGFSPQQIYGSPSYFPNHTPPEQQQQLDLQKRPIRKRRRPPHSYASLIAQAILTSRDQRLTLREIYEWVQTRYPHLYEANETGWQVGKSKYRSLGESI
jgi:hypothetical protein